MAIPDISGSRNGDGDRNLESWKEIAAFFERDLRTVIRWEKELGLPVHRYPGKAKGRVYAQSSELTAWADGPRRAAAEAEQGAETATAVAEPADEAPSGDLAGSIEEARSAHRRLAWSFALVGVLAAVLLGWFAISRYYHQQPRIFGGSATL